MTPIETFTNEYPGRLYYYALKKTGSEQDAADLAADICYEAACALLQGLAPQDLDAWVWAVARNRWARWARKNYYRAPGTEDLADYAEELAAEDDVEASVVHAEELALIRRELAFIRTDYRQILVAHYFEEMSVAEISRRFGIPIGTVKTKLQSSRRFVKEGMNMAKQFGTRSFQPETFGFVASGNQPGGLPWSAIRRKIPVNILCTAHNNPCTLEELSMEMGVAMPYMEEEVSLLEDGELIRRLENGRYITNFFISPKECQNEINELSCRFAEVHYRAVWELAGEVRALAAARGASNGAVPAIDEQMYFAFFVEQQLGGDVLPPNIFGHFSRRDGGDWGLIGHERGSVCRLAGTFFNNNGIGDGDLMWDGYQAHPNSGYGDRPYAQDCPDYGTLRYLRAVALGRGEKEFSAEEWAAVENLLNQGFCVRTENGGLSVAAVLFADGAREELRKEIRGLAAYQALLEAERAHVGDIREVVARYSVPYLADDFDYYVAMSVDDREIFAQLWKDKGLYTGGKQQFCALIYRTGQTPA